MDCSSISQKRWPPNPEAELPWQREGNTTSLVPLCVYTAVRGTDLGLSPLWQAACNSESKSCAQQTFHMAVFRNELVSIIQAPCKWRLFVLLTPAFRLPLNSCCLAVTAELGFLPWQQCTLASHPSPKPTCSLHFGAQIHNPLLSRQQCLSRQSMRTLASRPSFPLILVKHHFFPPSSHVGACNFRVETY